MHTAFGYRVIVTIDGNEKSDKLFCSPEQAWRRIAELKAIASNEPRYRYTKIAYSVKPIEIKFEN